MRLRGALMVLATAIAVVAGLGGDRAALAKGPYGVKERCPCAGPSIRTFWTTQTERLVCVDGVLQEFRDHGFAESVLARARRQEESSHCGDPAFQCDGTAARPCPGRMVCEVLDPSCDPGGATGTCVPRSKNLRGCRSDPSPVCGCDGTTYRSVCRLRRAGIAMAFGNTCDVTCGGPDRISCPDGKYCWADPSCDNADARGVCLPAPRCSSPVRESPVCGCNGQTYASVCELTAAGIARRHDGACDAE